MAYSFRLDGVQAKEFSLFRSLITLIEGRLSTSWDFDTLQDGVPDVAFLDIDEMGADAFQQACRRLVGVIPVIYGQENTLNSHFFLKKPARPIELANLLNELHIYLTRDQRTISDSEQYVDSFYPEHHFVGRIQEAAAMKKMVWLRHPKYPIMLVDGHSGTVYTKRSQHIEITAELVHKLGSIPASEVVIAPIDVEKVKSLIAAEQLKSYSLESILWQATVLSSNGSLYLGVSAFQPVALARWPDTQKIGRIPHLTKLAAYMLSHEEDLVTIANKTQTPFTRVVDFYNACLVLGYAKHPAINTIEAKPKTRRFFSELFGFRKSSVTV